MARANSLLALGKTCWRIESASRVRLIVDAAEYFVAAKRAMLQARNTLMLIGWDFDTRICFEPEGATIEGPNELGDFLTWLPEDRPELRIYLLKWDLGALQAVGRGMIPLVFANLTADSRLHFKLDGAHPPGAAHHSKIVVIDDAVAFCGGIDMTADRWDTREHLEDDPRRSEAPGGPSKPWHDATTAVSGPLARALGDLGRERWEAATGERLDPPPRGADIWPEGLEPTLRDVAAGVARTAPKYHDRPEIREIEAFYLEAIARAESALYFETQYLASRKIAEAMAARLREPEGPEIVVVMPQNAEGWLRAKPMDGARRKLLNMLWDADRHGRFGAFYPVTHEGGEIYVHAKVTVVDDRAMRVGSSNLNNRSMGFDTECDLIVDASLERQDQGRLREAIRAVRRDLLCEHLAVEHDAFEAALEASGGSLLSAVAELSGEGRSLRRFTLEEVGDEDTVLAENELADPEEPAPSFFARAGEALEDLAREIEGDR